MGRRASAAATDDATPAQPEAAAPDAGSPAADAAQTDAAGSADAPPNSSARSRAAKPPSLTGTLWGDEGEAGEAGAEGPAGRRLRMQWKKPLRQMQCPQRSSARGDRGTRERRDAGRRGRARRLGERGRSCRRVRRAGSKPQAAAPPPRSRLPSPPAPSPRTCSPRPGPRLRGLSIRTRASTRGRGPGRRHAHRPIASGATPRCAPVRRTMRKHGDLRVRPLVRQEGRPPQVAAQAQVPLRHSRAPSSWPRQAQKERVLATAISMAPERALSRVRSVLGKHTRPSSARCSTPWPCRPSSSACCPRSR